MILRYRLLIKLKQNLYIFTFAILILILNTRQAYSNASRLDRIDDDDFSNVIRVNLSSLSSSSFNKIVSPINVNPVEDNDVDICADFNISSKIVTNHSEECRKQLRESIYGPQHKSLPFVICMSIVYILILVCGFIGNLSTCYVIISNSCMHTTTNYYLFSLAVSDVLSLVTGLPVELYTIIVEAYPWAFGETFCIIRTFLFETTTIASVLTILTFTFERWLHICKAIYAQKFSSGFSRALKIILFIWFFSGTISLPYVFTTGVYVDSDDFPETLTCNTLKTFVNPMTKMIQLSVLFLFIVPMSLIIVMYILIGITLWKSSKNHKFHSGAKQLRRCIKSEIVHKQNIDNTSTSNTLTVPPPSSLNHHNHAYHFVKRDVSLPVLKHFSAIKKGKNNHLSESNSTSISNRINGNERTSKDFENFAYKNRQSRRDVVKMLCMSFFSY